MILNQVEGKYKVKNENLKPLHAEATTLLRSIPKHILEYIPRAQNARADQLSNVAMDSMGQSSVMSLVNIDKPEVITDIQVDLAVKDEEADLLTSTSTPTPNSPSIVCTTPIGFQGEGEGEDKREGESERDRDSVSDLAKEKEEGKDNALGIFTVQVDCSQIVLNYEERTMTVTVPFSDIKYNETQHNVTEIFPTISLLVDSTEMKTTENIVKIKKPELTKETSIMSKIKMIENDKRKLEKLLSSSVKNTAPKASKVVKVTGTKAVTVGEVTVVVEVEGKGKKRGSSEERNIIGMTA